MARRAVSQEKESVNMQGNRFESGPIYSKVVRTLRYEHLLAGVSGGVVSTVMLHPLDLVKVRFQVNEGAGATKRPEYRGIMHAMRSIVKADGISGLYRGVTPNVWGAGASWGLYFFFYNVGKTWMQKGNNQTVLSPGQHLLAASQAGLVTLTFTNPIWVTKTRLCLQYEHSSALSHGASAQQQYSGMLDALGKIYRYEGIRGLYKGFVPGVFGVSHGALQFMAYEEMKTKYNEYFNRPVNTRLGSSEYIVFAALSKMFAAIATYPYQVVRSRLQDQHRSYTGALDVIKQTWRYEGTRGFYKGIGAYLIHVTPNICIVFIMYEYITAQYQPIRPSMTRTQQQQRDSLNSPARTTIHRQHTDTNR